MNAREDAEWVGDTITQLKAEIDQLRERCLAYKGQVEAGSIAIQHLQGEIARLCASPDHDGAADVSEAVEAERGRCLRILAMRANIWRGAVHDDMHSPCAMSLCEECEDIAAAINNGLDPKQSSG